jgi:hypothetical protein
MDELVDLERRNLENMVWFFRDRLNQILKGGKPNLTKNELKLLHRYNLIEHRGLAITPLARKILESFKEK